VFRGGATVETPYENYKPKVWKISAPTGKGVAAVSKGNLSEITLVGSPRVSIEGDGRGASAYAEFDSLSGKVTGIRVTSPGCDYTFATASVHYGDTVLAEGLEVELEENVGAPFTKSGPGTLMLMATNTWCGATIVKDGVLTAGTDGAIPPATRLVLDGGTIDLGGFDFSFAGISGSGGTVVGGTAKIAGEWVVDGAELATNRLMKSFTTVSGDVEIEPGSRMRITGFDELDGAKVYRILRMAQGTLSGVENLVCDLPHGWRLLRSASGLAISKVKSVTVIVR
jgi:autotransporter-associated beta strand protein